jgi:hypothetical protein
MTRDFSKQRRDDRRPSSRNSPSGRYAEERSPRSARPRLNRGAGDRARENGAPQNHPDYRGSRNNRHGQPSLNNRRRESQYDQPSAPYSRNRPNSPTNYSSRTSNRPYSNRQDNYRHSEDAPYGNSNPRYHSTDYSVRNSGNPHFNDRRREDYSDRPGSHRAFRDNPRYRDYDNQYQDRNANRRYGYQERDRDDRNRYPRDVDRSNRSPRNVDRGNRPYPSRETRGPATQNPRWQSRPPIQRGNSYARSRQDYPRHHPQEEQFEGDYERFAPHERFDTPSAERSGARFNPSRSAPIDRTRPSEHPSRAGHFQDHSSDRRDQVTDEPPNRPVTRLPDGRVLKGPRPAQRRNAQFWHEIANDTDALVDSTHTPSAGQPADLPKAPPVKQPKPKAQPQPSTPRKRVASAVARGRKAGTRQTGTKKKARSTGPKPSKRGYKWPTP